MEFLNKIKLWFIDLFNRFFNTQKENNYDDINNILDDDEE